MDLNLPTNNLGDTPREIRALNSERVPGTDLTYPEAVHHAANYYKHEEEFRPQWSTLTPQQEITATAVAQLGASPTNTGNLRSISEALGVSDYRSFEVVVAPLRAWRLSVLKEIRFQAHADGCHP